MIFFYNGLCAIAIKRQIRAKKFMVWSVVALEGILSGGQVVAARWRGSSSAWIALCLRTMRAITLYELRSNLFNFFKGSRMQNSGVPDLRIFSTEFKQRFVFLFFEQCVLQKKSNKVHIFWEVHKFCKISTLDLTECTVVKVEISQNFVAFSEYIYELYIILSKSCILPIGIPISLIENFLFVSYPGIYFIQNVFKTLKIVIDPNLLSKSENENWKTALQSVHSNSFSQFFLAYLHIGP
jgi:hypothetical protein